MTLGVRTEFKPAGAGPLPASEKQDLGRRTLLRRMTGAGAAVVGAIAMTWADSPSAFAAPGCCDLAFPNGPWCGGSFPNDGHFTCPSGTSKRVWACQTATQIYRCWECDNGSTCWNGTVYKCSNWNASKLPPG